MCGGMRWMDRVQMREWKEGRTLPSSSTHRWDVSQFFFLSVLHLTVQMWEPVDGGASTGCLFHRFGKWGETRDVSFHTKTCRTHNTEHVYSTVSFIQMQSGFFVLFFRHRVALGYTEHNATNRTRLDRLLQTTSFVYMLCMPHR